MDVFDLNQEDEEVATSTMLLSLSSFVYDVGFI